jgi:hypothetical protein
MYLSKLLNGKENEVIKNVSILENEDVDKKIKNNLNI